MIEKVLNRKNLYKAYRKVVQNKGSAGVDGMNVTELLSYLENKVLEEITISLFEIHNLEA